MIYPHPWIVFYPMRCLPTSSQLLVSIPHSSEKGIAFTPPVPSPLLPDQRPSSLWWHMLMSFTQQKPEALGATRWRAGGHPGHAEAPLAISSLSSGTPEVGSLSATAAGSGDAELGTVGSRHQLSFLPGPHPVVITHFSVCSPYFSNVSTRL